MIGNRKCRLFAVHRHRRLARLSLEAEQSAQLCLVDGIEKLFARIHTRLANEFELKAYSSQNGKGLLINAFGNSREELLSATCHQNVPYTRVLLFANFAVQSGPQTSSKRETLMNGKSPTTRKREFGAIVKDFN